MSEEFTVSAFIPALPMAVYMAWLDGHKHTEMTGADAHVEPVTGGRFDAWDGYIHGQTVELDPGRRILQRWRTAEFPGDAPDSSVEITLAPEGNGTRLTLRHTQIPNGQGSLYEQGWHDHYFRPMQEYFIHAGISGVPHGARVTEVIRKVQSGEAAPMAQSADAPESTPPAELREPVEMSPIAAGSTADPVGSVGVPAGDSGFELADDDEDDAFDTSTSETSKTGADEFWKHLEPPTETRKQEPEELPAMEETHEESAKAETKTESGTPVLSPQSAAIAQPKRRKARRGLPAGAGKPAKKKAAGRKATKRKPAARKPAAGAKKAGKSSGRKASGATKKAPAKRKSTTKKAAASTKRKAAGSKTRAATKKKVPAKTKATAKRNVTARKKPAAKKKKVTKKRPAPRKKAAKSVGRKAGATKKKPGVKKAPAKRKPGAKKKSTPGKKPAPKKKPAGKGKAPRRGKAAAKKRPAPKKKPAAGKKPARKGNRK